VGKGAEPIDSKSPCIKSQAMMCDILGLTGRQITGTEEKVTGGKAKNVYNFKFVSLEDKLAKERAESVVNAIEDAEIIE